MPRTSTPQWEQSTLLDLWQRKEGFGTPVGCIATSFTFDSTFFEQECLARFLDIGADPEKEDRQYILEREEKLTKAFAAAFVDSRNVSARPSQRWVLLPISVRQAIQHSKVSLLAWSDLVRVIVSSANLTLPGYRTNLEYASVLDFQDGGALPIDVLTDVFEFLESVRAHSPGMNGSPDGPHGRCARFVKVLRKQVKDWGTSPWKAGEPKVHFVPVLPDGDGIIGQIDKRLWRGTGANLCQITSPFYDDGERPVELLNQLRTVTGRIGWREFQFVAPGEENPDGSYSLCLPAVIHENAVRLAEKDYPEAYRYFMRSPIQGDDRREIHAKGLWLERDNRALHIIGSSNFTHAGYGAGSVRNIEANVAFEIPKLDSAFAEGCRGLDDETDELDPEYDDVRFLTEPQRRTPDTLAFHPLPNAFGQALFTRVGDEPRLMLEIDPDYPLPFTISIIDVDGPIYTSAEWVADGRPAGIDIVLESSAPPSALLVTLQSDDESTTQCIWPVNAETLSVLPEPVELGSMTLDEILLVLTSDRPSARLPKKGDGGEPEPRDTTRNGRIDFLGKVDTRNHLIKRMRRVSRALAGATKKLSVRAYTTEDLRRRLFGPYGPVALAQAFVAEEQVHVGASLNSDLHGGAAFMIAEVIRAVRDADFRESESALGRSSVRSIVTEALRELHTLATGLPAPENLRAYVDEVLQEVAV